VAVSPHRRSRFPALAGSRMMISLISSVVGN
jgi:hypothetical protein